MDSSQLDVALSDAVGKLRRVKISANANYNAPIDVSNLEQLRNETANALNSFRAAIMSYLVE